MVPLHPRFLTLTIEAGKGKDAVVLRMELRRGAIISISQAIEPVGGYTTESVTHMVSATPDLYGYLPHPMAGTNLYCLVNRGTLCVNNLPRVVT